MLLLFCVFLLLSCSSQEEDSLTRSFREMQQFVVHIAQYARKHNPNFIIIPQNGPELAFKDRELNGLNSQYMKSVDGFGIEELFYHGGLTPEEERNYRLSMLQQLKLTKKIMVAEYVTDDYDIPDALNRNYTEDFLCFPRSRDNYYYKYIPTNVPYVNSNDITNLNSAQNYLYLINTENYNSKEDFLNELAATNFDVLLIDLFFNKIELTRVDVNRLKTKANGGKRLVIAYINIGAAERFRYYWKKNWQLNKPSWIKKPYQGYDDEFWVEFWHKEWQAIIYGNKNSYLKKILNAGFDGAYLDNVEAYYFLYYDD